ncbi:hypothetical protein L3i20_v221950 [Paenibacillus sp. L3-i20]|nr:hypothetical protein L3i20_v221950 [Paenibacillus sp. L3-i20]
MAFSDTEIYDPSLFTSITYEVKRFTHYVFESNPITASVRGY